MDINESEFQTQVIDRSGAVAVVVDFWAPWCGPCRTLGPILDKVIAETDGEVELRKVNVDENSSLAEKYSVQTIPAVFGIVNGEIVDSFVDVMAEHKLRDWVAGVRRAFMEPSNE